MLHLQILPPNSMNVDRKLAFVSKIPKVAFEIHCDLALSIDEKVHGNSGWSFRSIAGVGRVRKHSGAEKVHGLRRIFENQ